MAYALIVDGAVVAVTIDEPACVSIPEDLRVAPGWTWSASGGFKGPPPVAPWTIFSLDGQHEVEASMVSDKHGLPPGVNAQDIDNTRVSVLTAAGWVEIQNGDWLVRLREDGGSSAQIALDLTPGDCLRLSHDDAARRLS